MNDKNILNLPGIGFLYITTAFLIACTAAFAQTKPDNVSDANQTAAPNNESNTNPLQNSIPVQELGKSEEKDESGNKILFEAQQVGVSDEFLKDVGLDANSLKSSDTWSKYRVKEPNAPNIFIFPSTNADLLYKIIKSRNVNQKDVAIISRPTVLVEAGKLARIISYSHTEYFVPQNDQDWYSFDGTTFSFLPNITKENNIFTNMKLDLKVIINQGKILKINNTKLHKKEYLNNNTNPSFQLSSDMLIPNGNSSLILGPKISYTCIKKESRLLIKLPIINKSLKIPSSEIFSGEFTPLFLLYFTNMQEEYEKMASNKPLVSTSQYQPIDTNDPLVRKLDEILRELDMKNNPHK